MSPVAIGGAGARGGRYDDAVRPVGPRSPRTLTSTARRLWHALTGHLDPYTAVLTALGPNDVHAMNGAVRFGPHELTPEAARIVATRLFVAAETLDPPRRQH